MLFSPHYFRAFFWDLVVFLAFIGWGELVRRILRAKRIGWALRAAWGMSALLAICGPLQLAGVCNKPVLFVITLAGVGIAVGTLGQRLRNPSERARTLGTLHPRHWIFYTPLILLLAYLYVYGIFAWELNWWDDLPAYLPLVNKLVQSGSLVEPYSLRRILTFGGQQALQAFFVDHGTLLNVSILELGVARIVFAGLLIKAVHPRGRIAQTIAGLIVIVLLLASRSTLIAANTHSEMTGVLLLLALLRTLSLGGARKRWAAMAGVIAAAVSTMRVSFIPVAVFAILFFYLLAAIRNRRNWKRQLTALGAAAVACALALLPWSLALYQSAGTLLYPLWKGYQGDNVYFDADFTFLQKLQWLAAFVAKPLSIALFLPLLLALHKRFWRTELPMALAAAVTATLTLLSYTLSSYPALYRYVFPLTFAVTSLLILLLTIRGRTWWARLVGGAMVLLIAYFHVSPGLTWLSERRQFWSKGAEASTLGILAAEPDYRRAQQFVPPHAPIFSATSFPILFDQRRNPILIVDVPGAVSPPPGMTVTDGPVPIKNYLLSQGVEYLIFTFPKTDTSLYSEALWGAAYNKTRVVGPDTARCARFTYPFLLAMDAMPGEGEVLYRSPTLCVVHLKPHVP